MNINKHLVYQKAIAQVDAVLEGETNMILKMSTINAVIKEHLTYCYWVGFYCVNEGELIIGPYQGTLGCLHIAFTKGVCGRAAATKKVQIVDDVDKDPNHIACDAATNSEIVLPVFNNNNQLIAVFDIDSTDKAAFDEVDEHYLSAMLQDHFKKSTLTESYLW
jgi:L-methionine (R)-S-oxide reductase